MPTLPNTLTDAPTSPDRADRATFTSRAIALDDWRKNQNIPEMRVALAGVYANALEVYSSNPIAAAAAAAASAAQAATARDAAIAGLGLADQSVNLAQLTYGLDYALTQAANANKRIDVAQNYMVQTGTAQVTQTEVARTAVAQAADSWLVRANPTVTVTLPKAYADTDYQVIVEVESAAPTSATTAAAQYAAYAGSVEVTSRATNSFVITLTGSATTTNLRWKTLHPAATRNKTAFQEAYTYIYGTGHNPMTGVAI